MRKVRPFFLLLAGCLMLLLGSCSAPAVSGTETAAGSAFPQLDAETIEKATIAYTTVMDETETDTIRAEDTLNAIVTALNEAGSGKQSVAFDSVNDSVDGGEGYEITLYTASGEAGTFGFVLNPTKGYLRYDAPGAESLYFDLGESALKTLSAFYPA